VQTSVLLGFGLFCLVFIFSAPAFAQLIRRMGMCAPFAFFRGGAAASVLVACGFLSSRGVWLLLRVLTGTALVVSIRLFESLALTLPSAPPSGAGQVFACIWRQIWVACGSPAVAVAGQSPMRLSVLFALAAYFLIIVASECLWLATGSSQPVLADTPALIPEDVCGTPRPVPGAAIPGLPPRSPLRPGDGPASGGWVRCNVGPQWYRIPGRCRLLSR